MCGNPIDGGEALDEVVRDAEGMLGLRRLIEAIECTLILRGDARIIH